MSKLNVPNFDFKMSFEKEPIGNLKTAFSFFNLKHC